MVLGITMPLNTYAYNFSQAVRPDSTKIKSKISTKITDTRLNKPADPKTGVKLNFVPFKPAKDKLFANNKIMSGPKPVLAGDKILNNVKVYPNPISDYLNMTYSIGRDANVTIKIMDVLGNEIATLYSERLTAGDHSNSFSISSRITSGFYFVRVSVGTEIITKRISVL
ncbi:MAG: T9SS type A sorting domain-containing protein [Pedobacter sp.]|jgi:hypothetical protein